MAIVPPGGPGDVAYRTPQGTDQEWDELREIARRAQGQNPPEPGSLFPQRKSWWRRAWESFRDNALPSDSFTPYRNQAQRFAGIRRAMQQRREEQHRNSWGSVPRPVPIFPPRPRYRNSVYASDALRNGVSPPVYPLVPHPHSYCLCLDCESVAAQAGYEWSAVQHRFVRFGARPVEACSFKKPVPQPEYHTLDRRWRDRE